jgi:cobalt-zinc-cadmium efflux system protein
VLIVWRGWTWADPLASIVIAIFIVYAAWSLLRETVAVLMESAPGHIDVDEVRTAIATVRGVVEVHDLHVWTITSGMESLSAHVVTAAQTASEVVLADVRALLASRFGIRHVTIQVEAAAAEPCGDCD